MENLTEKLFFLSQMIASVHQISENDLANLEELLKIIRVEVTNKNNQV